MPKHLAGSNLVKRVEKVPKRTLWGYKGDDWIPFLKLTISDPKSLPKIRDKSMYPQLFSLLISLPSARLFERAECQFRNLFPPDPVPTFESNLVFTLRFMIDTKVSSLHGTLGVFS